MRCGPSGDLAEPGPSVFSWLSPIGWNQQIRAFAGDRWWVLALPVALCLVLVPAAFALRARRDLGAGLRAERPGPSAGSLSGVWDLAVRLQYRVLLAWAVAFLLFGVVIGSLVSNVGELLNSPNAQDLIKLLGGQEALTDAFLAAEISIMGVLAAAFGVSAANHLRSEESAGHTEALLGTATTRIRWASSHFVFALAGVTVLLLLAGVSIGVGAAFAVDDAALVGRSTVAARGPGPRRVGADQRRRWRCLAGRPGWPGRSGACCWRWWPWANSGCSGTPPNGSWTSPRSGIPRCSRWTPGVCRRWRPSSWPRRLSRRWAMPAGGAATWRLR